MFHFVYVYIFSIFIIFSDNSISINSYKSCRSVRSSLVARPSPRPLSTSPCPLQSSPRPLQLQLLHLSPSLLQLQQLQPSRSTTVSPCARWNRISTRSPSPRTFATFVLVSTSSQRCQWELQHLRSCCSCSSIPPDGCAHRPTSPKTRSRLALNRPFGGYGSLL